MKFKDGYMISSGQPVNEYIDSAVRHVLLRQVSLFSYWCMPTYFDKYNDCVNFTTTGCAWYQGEDHAWLGSQGQAGTNDPSSWFGDHPHSQRRTLHSSSSSCGNQHRCTSIFCCCSCSRPCSLNRISVFSPISWCNIFAAVFCFNDERFALLCFVYFFYFFFRF